MVTSQFNYHMPVQLVFGAGALNSLRDHAAPWGKKPFIITGRRSARSSGALGRVLEHFDDAAVWEGVEENPDTDTCDRAARDCRSEQCDLVIPLGGGSPMDTAKAVAGLALNDGPCVDYLGRDTFTNGALPIVAIPTTAGSGSEVTPFSVLVNAGKQEKRTIGGRNLFAKTAILDPELTLSLPRHVTINTGLDALSQAMEGMVSKKATAKGDILALETCRMVRKWLPEAADNPDNTEARAHMLFAATLSGCVIAQSGTTLVHGMGYPFTLEYGVAHGLANALLLPPLFAHNAEYAPERVAAIAEALGRPTTATPEDARTHIGEAIHALLADLGVSPAARDAGVEESRLEAMATNIASDPYRYRNQIGDITRDKIAAFYHQAYTGALAV